MNQRRHQILHQSDREVNVGHMFASTGKNQWLHHQDIKVRCQEGVRPLDP